MARWHDITRDPEYQDLSPEVKLEVKKGFFDRTIAIDPDFQTLSQEGKEATFEEFMQTPDDTGQGYVSSMLGAAGRGFGEVVPGAIEGVGALTGLEGLRETGEELRSGLESISPVNPIYAESVPVKLAGVGGQIGSVVATAGAGGLAGKMLGGVGAVSKGAKAASLGSAFLQGAAEGAREAEQYGMTGPEAYLRTLAGGATEAGTELLPFGMAAETALAKRVLAGTPRTGTFLGATASEGAEESLAQIGSNIATKLLAPAGVETPDITAGALEAGLYGAAGGAMLGGVNALISTPPERQTQIQKDLQAEAGAIPKDTVPDQTNEEKLAAMEAGGTTVVAPDGKTAVIPPQQPELPSMPSPDEVAVQLNTDAAKSLEAAGSSESAQAQVGFDATLKEILGPPTEPTIPTREEAEKAELEVTPPSAVEEEIRMPSPKMGESVTDEEDQGAVSMPMMVTRDMKQQLVDLGYSKTDINSMRPEEAAAIIKSGVSKKTISSEMGMPPETPPPVAEVPLSAPAPVSKQDLLTLAKSQPVGTKFTDWRGDVWEKVPDGWTLTSKQFVDARGVETTRPMTDEVAIIDLRNQLLAAPAPVVEEPTLTPKPELYAPDQVPSEESVYEEPQDRIEGRKAEEPILGDRILGSKEGEVEEEIVETDIQELQELTLRRGQAQNKVKGVKFTKKDEARFKELVEKLRPQLRETVDTQNDPIVGEDINDQPIRQSSQGTYYTFENGRVRTGPAFKEPITPPEAPQPSLNLPALIAVRDNNATPEQVQSLVDQGLVEQVDGQNIITEAGVAAMPEGEKPRLTPAERAAEVEGTAAPGGSAEAIANQPKKGDLVTVALGGREYPKTRILNVINTPEGVRYQVDVFGPKFVAESSIIAVEKPIIKTAPKVAATPQLIRQLGDIAVKNKQPLDQGYIDSIGGNIPQGYVKQGDLYVFQPQTTKAATVKSTELRVGDEVSFKGNTYRVKKILSDGRVRAEFTNPEGIARIPKGSENITTLPRNVNFTRIEKQPPVTAPVERDATKPAQMTPEEFEKVKNSLNVKRVIAQSKLADAEAIQPSKNPAVQIKQIAKQRARRQELDDAERSFEEFYPTMASAVEDAIKNRQPFSTAAHKEIGMNYIPSGYIRQGDLYVFQPSSASAGLGAGAATAPKGVIESPTAPEAGKSLSAQLNAANNRDEAKAIFANATLQQVKEAAQEMGYPATGTKTAIVSRLVAAVGSRADAKAIRQQSSQTTAAETQVKQPAPKKAKSAKLDESKAIAEYPDLETFFEREIFTSGKKGGWVLKEKRTGARLSSGKTKEEASADFRKSLLWQQAWNEEYPSVFEMVNKLIEDKSINAEKYSQNYKIKPSNEEWKSILEGKLSELRQDREDAIKRHRSVGSYPKTDFEDNFIAEVEARLAKLQPTAAEMPTPDSVAVEPGATRGVQAEPPRGSILEVEKVSPETEISSRENLGPEVAAAEQKQAADDEAAKKRQKKQDESTKNSLNSVLDPQKKNAVTGTVTKADVETARETLTNSGEIPNAYLTNVYESVEAFLADKANARLFPSAYARLQTEKNIEGLYENGQTLIFAKQIQVSNLDRNLAKMLGITPEQAAARRVIAHENGHKAISLFTMAEKRELRGYLMRAYSDEQIAKLVETYDEYADWRTNLESRFEALEELLMRDFEKMDKIPTGGVWDDIVQFLKRVWRRLTGQKGEPTLKNLKDVARLMRNAMKRPAVPLGSFTLKDGGKVKLSVGQPEFVSDTDAATSAGNEAARSTIYSERDMDVREAIRRAYEAMPKDTSVAVPIGDLFAKTEEMLPDVTQDEFSNVLQDLFEDNGAVLQEGESDFFVTTPEGRRAGFVVVMPRPTKASRIRVEDAEEASKSFKVDLAEAGKGRVDKKAKFKGNPLKDTEIPEHNVKSYVLYRDSAIKLIDDLMAKTNDILVVAEALQDPEFQIAIGLQVSKDVSSDMITIARSQIGIEIENRLANEIRKERNPRRKRELELAEKRGIIYYNAGTGAGQALQNRQESLTDPRYRGRNLFNQAKLQKEQKAKDKLDAITGGTDKITEIITGAEEKAAEETTQAEVEAQESVVEDDQDAALIREGEETLDNESKNLWGKAKMLIMRLAMYARADKSDVKTGSKASLTAEQRDELNAILRMPKAERDKARAKDEAELKAVLRKLIGEESEAKTPQQKKTRQKRVKMIDVVKKYAESGKSIDLSDQQTALKGMLREMNKARPADSVPLERAMPWRKILSSNPKDVAEYRQRIFEAISDLPSFQNLTDEQKERLADLYAEAWENRRQAILDRMLRDEIKKARDRDEISEDVEKKLQQSRNKILEIVNLGGFNNDDLVKILGERYGISTSFTEEQKERIQKLADQLQDEDMNTAKRNKLAMEFAVELAGAMDVPVSEIISNWWTSSVLFGPQTIFSIGAAFLNGGYSIATIGTRRMLAKLFKGDIQGAIEESILMLKGFARYLGAFKQSGRRAWNYLWTGDVGLLGTGSTDILNEINNFDQLQRFQRHKLLAEQLAKDPRMVRRYVGVYLRFVSRLLTALDAFNVMVTKAGTASLALRMSGMSTDKIIEAEKMLNLKAYKDQVIRDYFDNKAPKTQAEKALVDSYAEAEMYRAINKLGGKMENADYLASESAMTMHPTGFGGVVYDAITGFFAQRQSNADEYLEKMKKDWISNKDLKAVTFLALAYLRQFAAYNAAGLTGSKFVRYASNKFNQGLSFIPFAGLLRQIEAKDDRIKGKDAFRETIYRNQIVSFVMLMVGYSVIKAIQDEPDDEERGNFWNGGWANLTPDQKKQMLAKGQKEYTMGFKFNGRWYVFNYQNWPLNQILSAIGSMSDQIRFSPEKWDEKSALSKGVAGMVSGVKSTLEIPALSGLQELVGNRLASKDPTEKDLDRLSRVASGWVGGFVPRILKDIDFYTQPELRKYEGLWEKTASHIPIYRRYVGEEYYDILGKQIKRNVIPGSREFMMGPTEPEYKILGALNARNIFLTPANAEYRMVGKGRNRRRLTQEEADAYSLETGRGYRDMLLRYGQRALQMPTERARAFLQDKAEEVRDRALKRAYRR